MVGDNKYCVYICYLFNRGAKNIQRYEKYV